MLQERYNREWLAAKLIPLGQWHPWPKAAERAKWRACPPAQRRALVARARAMPAAKWPPLPATLYLEFLRNGNRDRFQAPYFTRRTQLGRWVLAECLEGHGAFLDPIADGIWSLCEESSWCLPAHIPMQQAGAGLPDTAEPIVDLFAAETAALLAWTHYLLQSRLDKVSPQLALRIAREVQARILTPCRLRDDFWWMGFQHKVVNNWNPWINSNWLTAALLLETDAARRVEAVSKMLRSLDVFLEGYPRDGGCDEGPAYWTRAGASLFDCLELLYSATGGAIDLYGEPLVREIGRFIYRAHIAGNWFINFADAPAVLTPPADLVFRFGRRINDPLMQGFAAAMAAARQDAPTRIPEHPGRALPQVFGWSALRRTRPQLPLLRDVWLPDIQVLVARTEAGSTRGLTLAAKGGHNAESHNHNDVGHFLVYADGEPVLVDAGVETYTRKTFSPHRYEIWTMQSQYHNLPTVNGVLQQAGPEFKAQQVGYAASDSRASLAIEMAGSYPAEAGLVSWFREITLERSGRGTVRIEDRYETRTVPRQLFFSLLTPCAVHIRPGGLLDLRSRKLAAGRVAGRARIQYDADRLRAKVETLRIDDPQLRSIWGPCLFRIVLRALRPAASDTFRLCITS